MPVPDPRALRARLDALLDAPADDAIDAPADAVPALGDGTRDRLVRYVGLLAKWNRVWNLTAVRDPFEMLERHALDCLALLPFVDGLLAPPDAPDPSAGTRAGPVLDLVDVGSGAGLPVLVLACARPSLRCLSIERTAKKARFQRQAVLELGLRHVEVRDVRAETVDARARIVTSRAFEAPADFLGTAARLSVPGGTALLMLGRAERLPDPLPGPWTLDRLVRTGNAPERHVALCRTDLIPYDRRP